MKIDWNNLADLLIMKSFMDKDGKPLIKIEIKKENGTSITLKVPIDELDWFLIVMMNE